MIDPTKKSINQVNRGKRVNYRQFINFPSTRMKFIYRYIGRERAHTRARCIHCVFIYSYNFTRQEHHLFTESQVQHQTHDDSRELLGFLRELSSFNFETASNRNINHKFFESELKKFFSSWFFFVSSAALLHAEVRRFVTLVGLGTENTAKKTFVCVFVLASFRREFADENTNR